MSKTRNVFAATLAAAALALSVSACSPQAEQAAEQETTPKVSTMQDVRDEVARVEREAVLEAYDQAVKRSKDRLGEEVCMSNTAVSKLCVGDPRGGAILLGEYHGTPFEVEAKALQRLGCLTEDIQPYPENPTERLWCADKVHPYVLTEKP